MANEMPSYAVASRRINAWLAATGQEWAGVPMPIPNLSLTIEEKNPWRDKIAAIEKVCHAEGEPRHIRPFICNADAMDWLVVNSWWSTRERREVGIVASVNPPRRYRFIYIDPAHDYVRRFNFAIDTMIAATAWTMDTELKAMERLADLLKEHLFEAYVATGAFIETSRRSGLTYLFRRCRPTVVFNGATQKIISCLCLHPIAYYQNTFAGGMCPTDDVIAHLMLMRGDEAMFWRRANQHPPDRPQGGL